MGIFLGLSGFLYEKAVLNVGRVYDWIGQKIHLDRAYYPILAFILILPVGILLTPNPWWWKSACSFPN